MLLATASIKSASVQNYQPPFHFFNFSLFYFLSFGEHSNQAEDRLLVVDSCENFDLIYFNLERTPLISLFFLFKH